MNHTSVACFAKEDFKNQKAIHAQKVRGTYEAVEALFYSATFVLLAGILQNIG